MNPLNLKTKIVWSIVWVSEYILKQSHWRLLEAFWGMYIPMYSPEQDHICFSIPIFIAIKNHIDIKRMKAYNWIIENMSFNIMFPALKEVVVGILGYVT